MVFFSLKPQGINLLDAIYSAELQVLGGFQDLYSGWKGGKNKGSEQISPSSKLVNKMKPALKLGASLLHWCLVFIFAGIAVDKYGLMYFVDATMIRKVDQNGIISTLLGSNDLTAVRPLSCDSSMDVTQVASYCIYFLLCLRRDGHLFWMTAWPLKKYIMQHKMIAYLICYWNEWTILLLWLTQVIYATIEK